MRRPFGFVRTAMATSAALMTMPSEEAKEQIPVETSAAGALFRSIVGHPLERYELGAVFSLLPAGKT